MSTLRFPVGSAEIIPRFPPSWAEVFGEDDFGIFAEFPVKGVRFVWRWIPPGRFLMGSPDDEPGRWDDEGPQREVTISRGFWMGETPVTQAQWTALQGKNPSRFAGENRPVEQVSWEEVVEYAARLNEIVPELFAALPSEAQWEYACRAGTNSAFSDGSPCTQPEGEDPALERLGWYSRNSSSQTHEVKEKAPNAWGLYDTHGNVWEWCRDAWCHYGSQLEMDPAHDAEDKSADRVFRGGSWDFRTRLCRSASRDRGGPGSCSSFRGFRLAAGQELRAAEPQGAERPPLPERRSRG